jgi:hypothetical protein
MEGGYLVYGFYGSCISGFPENWRPDIPCPFFYIEFGYLVYGFKGTWVSGIRFLWKPDIQLP